MTKIIKKFFQLDEETKKLIENSEGFNPNENGQTAIIYDMTDEATATELKKTLLKSKLLELVRDIDMDYIDDELNIGHTSKALYPVGMVKFIELVG